MNSGDVALAKFTDKSADGFAMNYTVAPVYARQVVNDFSGRGRDEFSSTMIA